MNRRSRLAIESELSGVEAQLETLRRRDLDFQEMLDHLLRMKEENNQEIQNLQIRRNELIIQKEPINWLPPEVLTQVFLSFNEQDVQDVCYRPAVIVSHVCKRWRAIALASQPLWSRIFLQGFRDPNLLESFLSRSGLSPLEVAYYHDEKTHVQVEVKQLQDFLVELRPSFSRLRSLSVECSVPLPFASIMESFQQHRTRLPRLQTLSLLVTTPSPSFRDTLILLQPDDSEPADQPTAKVARWTNSLRYLKLQEIPLFNFPTSFYSAITSLEISYSPKKPQPSDTDYFLKASTLCQFLAETPFLENLVIVDTVPVWDITIPLRDNSTESPDQPRRRFPIPLHRLKSFDWTYPQHGDVQRFLYLIDTPKLEKLDIWLDDQPRRPGAIVTGSHAPGAAGRKIFTLPCLTDFSFQCTNTESMVSLLHKLCVSGLKKVEFINVDPKVRQPSNAPIQISSVAKMPGFPRLESIFRDPRLPNLTHLTLSHFTILPDIGGAETILGYMPALTSLSLDSCFGVGKLIIGFQETVVGYISRGSTGGQGEDDDGREKGSTKRATRSNVDSCGQTRKIITVKCCPRLEALSFWNCQDLEIDCLRSVIRARNVAVNPVEDGVMVDGVSDPSKPELAQGRKDKGTSGFAGAGLKSGGDTVDSGKLRTSLNPSSVRKIKPLRRPRHQTTKSIDSDHGDAQAVGPEQPDSADGLSRIALKHPSPAQIAFLRVSNCKLLKREDVLAFKEYDVFDILWSGSD
ncbi:hypothetical protein CVT24_009999 [Panaeolus cyanescens]|uniref:F-box domain-containing protein n=1 Tax=Panaeolus cyanescens TaxID=181874 RepID=A0A409VY79_9AGAR|nr:hypothetical protein CVT24_009999 [Panaeolus cyanescens]